SVKAAVEKAEMEEGDMVMLNDPFSGGTHLPDITLVAPVMDSRGKPLFYAANRAHHSDVGGISPGSMPLSESIFQEGIIIPPVKIVSKGSLNRDILNLVMSNVRTPLEREGDFTAQIMANMTGIRRIKELLANCGTEALLQYSREIIDYSARMVEQVVSALPDGNYFFEDCLDDDGQGAARIPIVLNLEISGSRAVLDFSQSADQVRGCVNAVRSITLSCVLYVFRCLVRDDIPANSGCLAPLKVITRKGSVVDALFPCAVAGGNVETSQRIVDVILGALAQASTDSIPAASQGTMNNMAMGGFDPYKGQPFTYYETLAGGMGASCRGQGASAVHSHMTNTLNTPVEALEHSYPLLVREYSLRKDSGGSGQHCGGDGLVRELEPLCSCEISILSERRCIAPYGILGGEAGKTGKNLIYRNGRWHAAPGKFQDRLKPGERLRIMTPGGGGYGPA
ncbi:MAG: hydantoinase B/oxoprolinase family protein, partial [Desulfonatronovibrionaceae bacterium]